MALMYDGEEIIVKTIIKDGKYNYIKQYFPNHVDFPDTTENAYVIGNSISRKDIDLTKLNGVTYGCNALYRDFSPDFLVCIDHFITMEVIESGYADGHVVYAPAKQKLHFKRLDLIPLNPVVNAGATALHIACLHGFKKIYTLGFDWDITSVSINNIYLDTNGYAKTNDLAYAKKWPAQFQKVYDLWPDVVFEPIPG